MFHMSRLKLISMGIGLITLVASSLLVAKPNPFKLIASTELTSKKLLLTHHVYIPDIASDQSEPRLKIYTDGLVVLTYPPYFKKSGSYQSWLDTEQLQSLSGLVARSSSTTSSLSSAQVNAPTLDDGRIVMQASSAEKYDIIRHTLSASPSNMAAQLVIKQHEAYTPQATELLEMLELVALNTYTSNNK